MLLDPTLASAYLVVAAALAFSPGPDFMFVVANGMRQKVRGALASSFGISAGTLFHALAAAVGVSAVIAASPAAFELMRLAGAVYLGWLGIQAIRAFFHNKGTGEVTTELAYVPAAQIFLRGFLTNILNPKVIIFYLALLPQFVNVELGHVGLQIFLLGTIHNLIGLSFLVVVGLAAGRASVWIAKSGFGRWLDGIAGLFFLGLAARLALTGRPSP